MTLETKFIVFQAIIILPFLSGTVLGPRIHQLQTIAKRLVLLNLVIVEPPIILWSVWGLRLEKEMMVLPVAGAMLMWLSFLVGKISVRFLGYERVTEKVFVICSTMANHGFTMGGFLCFLFLGEKGLALSAIFIAYFIPVVFLFIFPYASAQSKSEVFTATFLKDVLVNLRNMPLYTAFFAIFLNLSGIERPDIYFPIDLLLTVSIALYYLTLGINFKFKDINPMKREHLFMACQKFVVIPLITFIALSLTPLALEIKFIIQLQSFMPVAVYAVIASVIFDLNSQKASSLFVINTIAFISLVLPAIFFVQKMMF